VLRYAEGDDVRVQVDPALVQTLQKHLDPEALGSFTLSIAAANSPTASYEALGTEIESR